MFIKLNDIDGMSVEKLEDLYVKHYNSAFYKLLKLSSSNIYFDRADGIYLWDNKGTKYMDFIAGFGSLNLGHNHPLIIQALKNHFTKPNLVQQSANIYNGVLGNNISYLTNGKLPICCMTNCGTEAVEEAIKLAYMKKKDGIIVYCSNAYHGKTLGSISALGNSSKKNFPNLDNIFIEIPFGDISELDKVANAYTVSAFLVEPIQGEAGIILPPIGYFKEVRSICDEHDIVLILDEIQTGLGRCGTMFCYEQFDIVPDIMCLSKSLSGGIIPVGCIAVKQDLWNATYGRLKNATISNTTFGGNTLASIVAIESLTIIKEEKLYERANKLGKYALQKLNLLKLTHDIITQVRGNGLLIGIEFGRLKKLHLKTIEQLMISTIISKMLNEYKIVCGFTTNNPAVLRFEPPLIVTKKEIDYFVESLDNVLKAENGELHLLIDGISNASKEFTKSL